MSADWYATVKYYNSEGSLDTEIVPVCKIRKVRRSSDNEVVGTDPWEPKTLTDFDKFGYNYSVLTSKNVPDGQESRYYAMIGRLAVSLESLSESSKRITWVTNVPPPPSNSEPPSTDEESNDPQKNIILSHQQKNLAQAALKRQAKGIAFQEFLSKKSLHQNGVSFNDQASPSASTEALLKENAELRSQLEERTNQQKQYEDLKKLIESVAQSVIVMQNDMSQNLSSVNAKLDQTDKKFCDIGSKLSDVADMISKSAYQEKMEFVRSWLNSIA